jgi:hypothetical protein
MPGSDSSLSWQRRIASRLFWRKRFQRAAFLAALGASHALRDVLEPSIPAAQATERKWFGFAFMPALRTLQHQSVLAELVAQFVDVKASGHGADCCRPAGPESTQFQVTTNTV